MPRHVRSSGRPSYKAARLGDGTVALSFEGGVQHNFISTVRWDRALGSETGRRTDHVMLRTLSPNQRSRFLRSTFISKHPPLNTNSHLHRPQHSHTANDTPHQTPQPSRPRPCRTAHHNKPCTANDGPWTLPIS